MKGIVCPQLLSFRALRFISSGSEAYADQKEGRFSEFTTGCVQRAGLPLRLFLFRTPGGGYELRLGGLECPIPSQLIPQVFEVLA